MALHVKLIEFMLTWLNSPHAGSFRSDLLVGWLKSNICLKFFLFIFIYFIFSRRNKFWTLETLMRYIPEIVFDQLFLCVRIYFIFVLLADLWLSTVVAPISFSLISALLLCAFQVVGAWQTSYARAASTSSSTFQPLPTFRWSNDDDVYNCTHSCGLDTLATYSVSISFHRRLSLWTDENTKKKKKQILFFFFFFFFKFCYRITSRCSFL